MKKGIVELPLAALVEDLTIYPRHAVDPHHIASLVDAIRAGNTLPPIIVEKGTNRIVDGMHRARALRKVLGENGTVAAITKEYATEADLLLDAISMNASHGRKLDRMDQARAVLLAEAAGVSVQAISVVLHMPEEKVQQLRIRVAYTEPGGPPVVLKRPAAHLSGKILTEEQRHAHQSMPGTSLLLTARQLRISLESGIANSEDGKLRLELVALQGALGDWLVAHPGEVAA